MKKGAFIVIIISLLISVFPCGSMPVSAAGASLFLSPASGEYILGKNFTVRVMVNSGGGIGINASEGALSFDPGYIQVVNLSESGSIFELWTSRPAFSNTKGTITYGGGLPSAYKGSAGAIFSVTFSAKKVGTTKVNFTSGVVLAADGKGTNVFSGFGHGTYTIKEPEKTEELKPPVRPTQDTEDSQTVKGILPPAPEVSSPTHPKEDVWYSNNNPEFSWKLLSDVIGVSFEISDDPDTLPDSRSDGIMESQIFEDIEDGEGYFHIKYQNRIGWGKITHRKFLTDATFPVLSGVSIDDEGDPTNPAPLLRFKAEDETSGINSYTVILDRETFEMRPDEMAGGYYRLKILNPGEHELELMVSDRADNIASSSLKFIVEPLKPPIITEIPRIISKKDELVIRGTSFYPNVTVNIFIGRQGEKEDKTPTLVQAKTDDEGNWNYFHQLPIEKGIYEVWARITDNRGAQSMNSTKHVMTVVSPSIIETYGWLIILILLLIILLESLYIIYLRKKHEEEKRRIQKEVTEAKQRLSDIFAALREEVDELMELADKRRGLSESERRVKEKLQEALNISQEFLDKELEDVEKEVKLPKEEK